MLNYQRVSNSHCLSGLGGSSSQLPSLPCSCPQLFPSSHKELPRPVSLPRVTAPSQYVAVLCQGDVLEGSWAILTYSGHFWSILNMHLMTRNDQNMSECHYDHLEYSDIFCMLLLHLITLSNCGSSNNAPSPKRPAWRPTLWWFWCGHAQHRLGIPGIFVTLCSEGEIDCKIAAVCWKKLKVRRCARQLKASNCKTWHGRQAMPITNVRWLFTTGRDCSCLLHSFKVSILRCVCVEKKAMLLTCTPSPVHWLIMTH